MFPMAVKFCWYSSTFLMPYCVPGVRALNRTDPYFWSWRRLPAGQCAQAGVGCGKPGCSQAGEGAFPEGMSWEQRALYLFQRVFLGGAQTLCALTFPFCKRN